MSTIKAVLREERDLDDEEILSIADQLAIPVEALFAHAALPLFPSIDFRTQTPKVRDFNKGTLDAIGFVERLSSTFVALQLDVDLDASVAQVTTNYSEAQAIKLAATWRATWGVSVEQQLEWKDANQLYVSLRSFIESLGIFVTHRTFGDHEAAGLYVHIDDGPHVVVINTTGSSKARKLFTLAHEFCHVLLRQEGASNPSVLRNRVEKFCNKFAAYLLAPPEVIGEGLSRYNYVPSVTGSFIRLFAKNLGISQEALVLRLVEEGHFDRTDYFQWRKQFKGITPPGDLSDGQSGGKTDPLQTKRTTYGSALLGLLGRAWNTGQLDELDIYRLCGLKPKYQQQLFEAV